MGERRGTERNNRKGWTTKERAEGELRWTPSGKADRVHCKLIGSSSRGFLPCSG